MRILCPNALRKRLKVLSLRNRVGSCTIYKNRPWTYFRFVLYYNQPPPLWVRRCDPRAASRPSIITSKIRQHSAINTSVAGNYNAIAVTSPLEKPGTLAVERVAIRP